MIARDNHPEPPVRGSGHRIARRLAAILAWDISGYSALMGRNEEGTHRRVGGEVARVMKEIQKAKGRVFSFAGDGLMAEFPSSVEALKCAMRIQADSNRRNTKLSAADQLRYRIGINSGEIIVQDGRTGGNAINIAARLEQIAEPGGICLSQVVLEQVSRVVSANYVWFGERKLKNIRDPVAVYMITAASFLRSISSAGTDSQSLSQHEEYRPSLAVLPFRTLQEDRSDAYFAEGMVDDIIRALGGLKDLVVVSRSCTIGYADTTPSPARVGRELNVNYILRGSVRRASGQVRIAVELVDAEAQSSIWADRFDGELADIFDLQDRIALRTASRIYS
jgi:adenylate cyclase